jgi:hypothetical protein
MSTWVWANDYNKTRGFSALKNELQEANSFVKYTYEEVQSLGCTWQQGDSARSLDFVTCRLIICLGSNIQIVIHPYPCKALVPGHFRTLKSKDAQAHVQIA